MFGCLLAALFPVLNPVSAVVTDIEGTTTSISFVHDTLFPYAKQNVREFLLVHHNEPEINKIVEEVQAITACSSEEVCAVLLQWMQEDKKITPLKSLQGLMWEEGYRQGAFRGHVYEDAHLQLNTWKNCGIPLYVYSSGSVHAQKLLFSFSEQGDMSPLFSGYFDTKIGGKKEVASYRSIAEQVGVAPGQILFLSDVVDELNAARAAGMQTVLLCREGIQIENNDHPVVVNFNEIKIL